MTGTYLKVALTIYGVFTAVNLLIQAQPYHNDDLRALLTPTGCPMPCFMGIRPGVTTLQEALVILDSHADIRDVQVNDLSDANPAGRIVQWFWTDEPGLLRAQDGIIVEINLTTHFTLADIWLVLGTPKQGGFDLLTNTIYNNNNVYPELGLRFGSTIACPFQINNFWNAPQLMVFFARQNQMGLYDPAYLSQFTRKFRDEYKHCWTW